MDERLQWGKTQRQKAKIWTGVRTVKLCGVKETRLGCQRLGILNGISGATISHSQFVPNITSGVREVIYCTANMV